MGFFSKLGEFLTGTSGAVSDLDRKRMQHYNQMKNLSDSMLRSEYQKAKDQHNLAKKLACAKIATERGITDLED